MDFIDIKDSTLLSIDTLHHHLEALLEIAPKLGARDKRTQVKLVDATTAQ